MITVSNTMNIMTYEVLQHINDLLKQDKAKGIEFLQNNRSRVVIEGYLKMNYDPSIVFQLPPGEPPFKKQVDVPDGYCLTDLKQEFRRMRIFTDATMNLSKIRREQLWLQMCEGLFWKEAVLINKIKDRRITDVYDQLTVDVVRLAYPTLLPEVVADPLPDDVIVPVEFGDDPSKIPEDELIKKSIEAYLREEDKAKKAVAGAVKPVPAQRKKPGPKPKQSVSVVTERKKPGPKPKQKS